MGTKVPGGSSWTKDWLKFDNECVCFRGPHLLVSTYVSSPALSPLHWHVTD